MHPFNYECSLYNLPVMCFSENAQQSGQPCLQTIAAQQVATHIRRRHLAAQKRHTGNAESSPTKKLRHTAQTTTVQRRQMPTSLSIVLRSHSIVQPVIVEQAENQLEMSGEGVSQSAAQSADVVGELAARQIQSVTAADLSPLPHADPATRVRSTRRTQGTLVLTSSPNVRELKEKIKMKEESNRRR